MIESLGGREEGQAKSRSPEKAPRDEAVPYQERAGCFQCHSCSVIGVSEMPQTEQQLKWFYS
jgi:hypothetical protein